MNKKEMIIYGSIALIAIVFFLFKQLKNSGNKTSNSEQAIMEAPDYEANGYYSENEDANYTKFNLFEKRKANNQTKVDSTASLINGVNAEDAFGFEELREEGDSNRGGVGANVKGEAASNNQQTQNPNQGAADKTNNPNASSKHNTPSTSDTEVDQMIAGRGIGVGEQKADSSSVKPNVVKRKKKISPKATFNLIEVELDKDTTNADQGGIKDKEVLKFYKAELFGSQQLKENTSIQIKCKDEIRTPDLYFPPGTIFFGNVKQKSSRFTIDFHRALYNYNDYPIEKNLSLYDINFTEGILILDFMDKVIDENTDQVIDQNSAISSEMAASQQMTTALLQMGQKTAKSIKKHKVYTVDLEDGQEVYIACNVPKEWFYQTQEKSDEYDY